MNKTSKVRSAKRYMDELILCACISTLFQGKLQAKGFKIPTTNSVYGIFYIKKWQEKLQSSNM